MTVWRVSSRHTESCAAGRGRRRRPRPTTTSQLARDRHAHLAGDLRVFPALGRFDHVPQLRAVLRPRGRISRGQNLGPVEVIARAVVVRLVRC